MILVVDDEAIVAEVLGDVLKVLGYEAVCTTDGQEAMALLEDHGNAIRLAVIDLRLRGESGVELFRKLKNRSPRLKGILISGYPSQKGDSIERAPDFDRCLAKPFSIDKVAEVVKEVLAEGSRRSPAATDARAFI